ncbi:hypothetical protein F2Q69_00052686 [Brassica cretica]|uniref:PRONE domain-containing protein n=1 Tax=Brassica cretica TaxID=69181 RepID=A0A8S9N388_BRACR|nr:hypothetical protein F2Q69_00052686 [Brassica cretica]
MNLKRDFRNLAIDKWWLPLPRAPSDGLSEQARKKLDHTPDLTNQILKSCMSINSIALAEMEVPQAYLEALPENGRSCLGDFLIETSRLITSQQITCLESRTTKPRAPPSNFYSFGMVPSGSSHKNNWSSNQSLYFNVAPTMGW